MKLLEYQGKGLLARHRIAVPKGALWPGIPAGVERFAVKAQIPAGKRGKSGGIRFADSAAAAGDAARALAGRVIGGHRVDKVYVEERLEIARELYLAVAVDRDARCRTILASPDGGVEIESVPAARVLKVAVDPLLGMRPFVVSRIVRFLGVAAASAARLAATVAALHDLALGEDAELAEINPLVVTAGGEVVAADAKVVLDGRSRFRHPDWAEIATAPEGTAMEQAVAAAGGVAAEIDPQGEVVAVISGAGLMMASLDMLVGLGVRVRAVVDMAGTPFGEAAGLVPLFKAVAGLNPKVTFINAFFHTALADKVAQSIANAYAKAPLGGKVLARLVGRNAEDGRAILARLGFEMHDDFQGALGAVAAAADGGCRG